MVNDESDKIGGEFTYLGKLKKKKIDLDECEKKEHFTDKEKAECRQLHKKLRKS